jgi:hypothetical protein
MKRRLSLATLEADRRGSTIWFDPAVQALAPEQMPLCRRMVEVEKKMDRLVRAKRCQIDDTLRQPKIVYKKCRVFVHHTHKMIPTQQGGTTPAWVLRVEGQLLGDSREGGSFSEHLSKIEMQIEGKDYAEHKFEWVRNKQTTKETDGFEITRLGDKPCIVQISLSLRARDDAKTFRPSETLRDVISKAPIPSASTDTHGAIMYDKQEHGHVRQAMHEGTLKEILMALWQYIKANHLQDPNNRKLLICDSHLQMLFGKPTVNLAELHTLLEPHLAPTEPIMLTYRIGPMPSASAVAKTPRQRSKAGASESKTNSSLSVDISVPVLQERQAKMLEHLQSSVRLDHTQMKEAELLEQRIQLLGQQLHHHSQQHQLLSRLTPYPSGDRKVAAVGAHFVKVGVGLSQNKYVL